MTTLPAVPPIPDADRVIFLAVTSPTSVIPITFPVFGAQEDLQVIVNFVVLDVSQWTFTSASGPLTVLPLPITDGIVTLLTPISSGTIEIIGNWQARQVIQPSAPGISRREFNQVNSTVISSLREVGRALRITPQFVQIDALGNGFYNAFGHLISNVADAQSPQDAVNLETLTTELSNFFTTGGISQLQSWSLTGDGVTLVFSIPSALAISSNSFAYMVSANGLLIDPSQYTINTVAKTITFLSPPYNAADIRVRLFGVTRALTNAASTAQAIAGTDDTTYMSPLKTAQAVASDLTAFLASTPAFASPATGINAAVGDNTTKLMTTAARVTAKRAQTFVSLTSGSGTWTTPAGAVALKVRTIGGGGGGGGAGQTTTGGAGGAGGVTTFGSLTCPGGAASPVSGGSVYPSPASATGGDFMVPGALGSNGNSTLTTDSAQAIGGNGAASWFGGGGAGGAAATTSPTAALCYGAGGGGGVVNAGGVVAYNGWGGNAGAYLEKTITAPAASYAYAVGAAGAGGTAGTSGTAGAAGAAGVILIEVYF